MRALRGGGRRRPRDYSASGDIVCTRCASVQDIEATEERAVAGMKALGFGNIATGALAWLLNPFFLFSIASVVSALVVLRAVHGPWYRQRMSARDRAIASAAAIAGAVVGLYPIRALLFALVGIGLD